MRTPVSKMLELQYVKRWTLVETAAVSNVASHSFNVAVIAMAIFDKKRVKVGFSKRDVCYYAILHDSAEAYTGDIPTPTKEMMRKAGIEPNTLPGVVVEEKPAVEVIEEIIKVADKIENYLFIRDNCVCRRAKRAVESLSLKLNEFMGTCSEDVRESAAAVLREIIGENNK